MTTYQYIMLRFMRENGPLSVNECLTLRQRTFGSLCKHNWIEYAVTSKSFHVNKEGRRALNEAAKLRRPTTQTMKFSSFVMLPSPRVVSIRLSRRRRQRAA